MELESDSKIFFRLFLKISENILKTRINSGSVRKDWGMRGLKNHCQRDRKIGNWRRMMKKRNVNFG